jgi:multidrug efflux pump
LKKLFLPKILKKKSGRNILTASVDRLVAATQRTYASLLAWVLRHAAVTTAIFVLMIGVSWWLLRHIPSEYAPKEDRGAFFVLVNGPEAEASARASLADLLAFRP